MTVVYEKSLPTVYRVCFIFSFPRYSGVVRILNKNVTRRPLDAGGLLLFVVRTEFRCPRDEDKKKNCLKKHTRTGHAGREDERDKRDARTFVLLLCTHAECERVARTIRAIVSSFSTVFPYTRRARAFSRTNPPGVNDDERGARCPTFGTTTIIIYW